jgi:hypothetical protein
MKKTEKMIKWLIAGGVAMAMVTSLTAQTGNERVGEVVRLKGAARYSTGNNVWQPVKLGTKLKAGYIIQTAQDSIADIVLVAAGETSKSGSQIAVGESLSYQPTAEQDVIRVSADTALAFEKLSVTETGADQVTDTQLDLRSGRIFGTVKKLSAASRYEIKIPNGVAGIRGTIYTISADGVVQVLVGSVVIAWTGPDGVAHTQVVSGGQQFDIRSGVLSPIPNYDQKSMVMAAKASRIGPNTPPQQFVVDHTIYYVSPRTGNNGNSGGNGGN